MKHVLFLLIISVFTTVLPTAAADSPYRNLNSNDWIVFGGSGALGLTAYFQSRNMSPMSATEIAALDKSQINRWDRPATGFHSKTAETYSDWGMRAAMLLPAFLAVDKTVRQDGVKIALMYLETVSAVGALTEISKVTVKRIRPYAYCTDPAVNPTLSSDARKSFFSGHTSTSFAGAVFFAKVFSDYYPDSRWRPVVWAGSLTLASSVAYARVAAGKHFPSDVVVGALVGGVVGYWIPQLHKSRLKTTTSFSPFAPTMIGFSVVF
jgi:membrane-associated phospholipid phosphatase